MKPPFQPLLSVAAQEPWAQPCSNGTEPRPSGSGWHGYSLTETKVQPLRWSLGIDGQGVGLNAANDQAFRFNVIERMGSVDTFLCLLLAGDDEKLLLPRKEVARQAHGHEIAADASTKPVLSLAKGSPV